MNLGAQLDLLINNYDVNKTVVTEYYKSSADNYERTFTNKWYWEMGLEMLIYFRSELERAGNIEGKDSCGTHWYALGFELSEDTMSK